RIGQPTAALHVDTLGAGQVERDALAQSGVFHRLPMDLDGSDTDLAGTGQHAQLLAGADFGSQRRTGYDGAVTLDNKRAIDRQPDQPGCAARLKAVELRGDFSAQ